MELLSIIETYILSAAHSLYNAWGWFGLTGLLPFGDGSGITPSEIILGLAGWMLISEQQLPSSMIFLGGLFATIGSVLGVSITYWVARLGGRPIVDKLARWMRMDFVHIHRAEKQFQRWCTDFVLVGRFIPGKRTLINTPAGLARMPYTTFFAVTFIGSYVWCILFISAANVLGNEWTLVSTYPKLSLHYLLISGCVALAIHYWFSSRSLTPKYSPVQVDKK
jgi:membrane protein DedA with SNARE-associated domain